MNITVTHTLHPDVIELVKSFLKTAPKAETPVKSLAVPAPAQPPVSTQTKDSSITIELIREKALEKKEAGKSEQIKKLLPEFGVKSISNLVDSQYADFYNKLKDL